MRFNFLKRKTKERINYEGARAFAMTPETELYTAVVTASLNDNFYEKSQDRLSRIEKLIEQTDVAYVARLAVYARTRMNMRSIPLVLAVELAKRNSGNSIVSKAVQGVVQRADEITELLAYYQAANRREGVKKLNKLSKQVQKGLAGAFNEFDEYQFAKYNRDSALKLRDALFLVHPKAKDEAQQELFNKIVDDTLSVPYTWETELTALGQQMFESKDHKSTAIKAKWEELADSNRLGYMAMLRNLSNMLRAGISYTHLKKVCDHLADPGAVAASRQLPFRFLAAYREVKQVKSVHTTMVLNALEAAVTASAGNISGFDEQEAILIACDVSRSMQKSISARSTIQLYDIGLVLGMLIQSRCSRVVTGMFGDTWKVINMPSGNVLTNVQEFYRREGEVGYATNGYLVIADLIKRNVHMDKVLMFTDCQLWNNRNDGAGLQQLWKTYHGMHPQARLYLFDLAGYGSSPVEIKEQNVHLIAGWSDKIFDVLAAIEKGGNAIDEINAIVL